QFGFDEDVDGGADALLGALGHQFLGELVELLDSFGDGLLGEFAVESGRFGAVLVGVAEDADGVEAGLLQEGHEFGEVLVGLAGEADDEVGADARFGGAGADGLHQFQEAFAVAEAAHAAQQGAAGVLEGQVEVGHDAGGAGEDVDESGADLGRLQVADADAFDAGDFGEAGQELLQGAQVAEVLAVGGGVLADQEQFADALAGEAFGFAEDVVGVAGEVGAAEGGDGAEGAAAVAAGGDLEVGDGAAVEPQAGGGGPGGGGDSLGPRGGVGAGGLVHAGVGPGRGRALGGAGQDAGAPVGGGVGDEGASGEDVVEALADPGVVVEADDLCLGHGFGQFRPVPFGHAAGGDDLGAVLGRVQQCLDGVLFGGFDEAAGVDDDDVGFFSVVTLDEGPAVGGEPPGEFFGVGLVARAPEGDERDSTAR